MYFRCSHCGVDLHAGRDSVFTNSSGKLASLPWFRDDRGLNIYATTCLHCGAVHATSGSPMKGLLTLGRRMLSVHLYLTPDRLQQLISDQGNPLPPQLISLLEERGFLGGTDELLEDEEVLDAVGQTLQAAIPRLALYCAVVRHRDFSASSVLAFLEHAASLEEHGEATEETQAAEIIRGVLASGVSAAVVGGKAGEHYYTQE